MLQSRKILNQNSNYMNRIKNTNYFGYYYDLAFYVLYKFDQKVVIYEGGYAPDIMAATLLMGIIAFNVLIHSAVILSSVHCKFAENSNFPLIF